MPKERPCVLSIAGFDPSGGAGILADIKTFEQHKVTGMAVVTCLTFQNDSEFIGVSWVPIDEIKKQIDILCKRFKFEVVKIGIIKNLETADSIISHIKSIHPNIKIIWDPILKASAGFEIHKEINKKLLQDICKKLYLITPNIDEIKILSDEENAIKAAKDVSKHCHVFLKGGHDKEKLGRDYLFTNDGKEYPYKAKKISTGGKHGSGCVLSSSITANLSNGNNLLRSCLKAKDYTTKFLMSNKTLLGYHKL
ncbi:MAG TPA: hydroxymethylpyrimidine/phosphomethylpyrimidine kinase [Bacteroidia bacterium]|nr:hydroxymethylpyrimidine/phosphomethylpyrimidine kinase [Bacteroidia bacterium]